LAVFAGVFNSILKKNKGDFLLSLHHYSFTKAHNKKAPNSLELLYKKYNE